MNSSNSSTVAKRARKAHGELCDNTGSLFIIDEPAARKFLLDTFKQSSKDIEKLHREGVVQSRFERLNG